MPVEKLEYNINLTTEKQSKGLSCPVWYGSVLSSRVPNCYDGDGLMVGINDLRHLFQPPRFCDYICQLEHAGLILRQTSLLIQSCLL